MRFTTIYDVQQLLKRFGTFIYTGDRKMDLELMQAEVKELYDSGMLMPADYQQAVLCIRQALRLIQEKNE